MVAEYEFYDPSSLLKLSIECITSNPIIRAPAKVSSPLATLGFANKKLTPVCLRQNLDVFLALLWFLGHKFLI